MRSRSKFLALLNLMFFFGSVGHGATITGTVKSPEGAPYEGAFVEAQSTNTRITAIVLSDRLGQFRIEKLPAGEYRLQIRAVGFSADPQSGVNLTADQRVSYDFALEKGTVRWNDISYYQANKLWPAAKGKELIAKNCSGCHLFQTRMAAVRRDADGWRDRVEYMRTAMHFSTWNLTDHDADDIASYLTKLFGPDSVLPKSPADMPGYAETLRPFSRNALNIVYVEYDMPGPNRMPFSSTPDKNGYMWIPNTGVTNKITRLDPKTGDMQDFAVPNLGPAVVHSTAPSPDGSVWFSETATNKLGRWDPDTQQITQYQDAYFPGKEGLQVGGQKHTVRLDASGNVWASGTPLTKFDPETKKFTRFEDVTFTYDIELDKYGDTWFTTGPGANTIGKVDRKTLKVSQWALPTENSYPRRMAIAPDGMIWVGEFNGGKLARFDPRTQTFKEYLLPGPAPTPYGLGFDADGYLWYDSHFMDVLGRFDTRTGKVIEYPVPHSEITMREFFRDAQGKMWYGTPSNNKVGYFYVTNKGDGSGSASK